MTLHKKLKKAINDLIAHKNNQEGLNFDRIIDYLKELDSNISFLNNKIQTQEEIQKKQTMLKKKGRVDMFKKPGEQDSYDMWLDQVIRFCNKYSLPLSSAIEILDTEGTKDYRNLFWERGIDEFIYYYKYHEELDGGI